MFLKRYGNVVMGVFFLLLAVVYFCLADALPPSKVMRVGPAFVPKIVAWLTLGLALILTVTSLRKLKSIPAAAVPDEKEYGRVLLTICVFGTYVMFFEVLGFPLATFLYLLAQMPIMAPKEKINPLLFAGIALVTSVGVYYIFKFWLDVMLPVGLLRGYVL